jgi:hypothetical protein
MPRASTNTRSTASTPTQVRKKGRPNHTQTATASTPTSQTPEPSALTLLNHSQQTTDEWYKSARTKAGYANYVKSGKKWLEKWVAGAGLVDEDEGGMAGHGDGNGPQRSSFADAFDSIISQTPTALRLLTAYKCDHQGRGFATAEGLRSAFKHFFER